MEKKGRIAMKILITGATGQLGYDCVKEFRARGHEVHGVSSELFPLSDENVMRAVIEARTSLPAAVSSMLRGRRSSHALLRSAGSGCSTSVRTTFSPGRARRRMRRMI